jgi:hypothetical protein
MDQRASSVLIGKDDCGEWVVRSLPVGRLSFPTCTGTQPAFEIDTRHAISLPRRRAGSGCVAMVWKGSALFAFANRFLPSRPHTEQVPFSTFSVPTQSSLCLDNRSLHVDRDGISGIEPLPYIADRDPTLFSPKRSSF